MENLSIGKSILQKVHEKAEVQRNLEAEKKAKRKKIVFIRRIIAVSILMIGMFTVVSFASGLFDKEVQEQRKIQAINKEVSKYDQVELVVKDGDTAWSIQKQLTPGKDIRDMLYLVKHINHRSQLGEVKSGEVLTFLKEKKSK